MKKVALVFLAAVVVATALPAAAGSRAPSNVDPPIVSFQAPATYYPGGRTSAGVSKTAFTDAGNSVPFVPLVACRQYDSRSTSKLPDNTPLAVTLSGAPCGIPTQAIAVAVNITVFNMTGNHSNSVFKVANFSPPTTAWINYPPTETMRGNAGVLPVDTGAVLYVQVNQGAGSVDLTVDVFGYYSDTAANQANPFSIINNSLSSTIYARNDNSLCTGGCGIYAQAAGGDAIAATAFNGTGVVGYSTGGGDGVFGRSKDGSGAGVHGMVQPPAGAGSAVWGENQLTGFFGVGVHGSHAGTGWGVFGEALGASGFGAVGVMGMVQSSTSNSYGVVGKSLAASGASYGVYGFTGSSTMFSAGVLGSDNVGASAIWPFATSGVKGTGQVGVIGISGTSGGVGVMGMRTDSLGSPITVGELGGDTYGLYAIGDFGASGTKSFVAPHPTDPTLVINYVALEGPEAGTYFRGRGRFNARSATIVVPESFRLVTDPDGLSIQVTPVGDFAQVAVISIGLDTIELKATRDVEFFYTVNGVRRAYRDHQPIAATKEYVPRSEQDRMPLGLSAEAKRWLVANGTYNDDGTVNMETAHRVGWVRVWEERKIAADSAAAARREAETRANLRIPLSR